MTHTIAAVMAETRNYFTRREVPPISGSITISGGMVVSHEINAPYIYIKGSTFRDGLWEMAGKSLVGDNHPNETFDGCIWLLYPPRDFLALCEQVAEFEAKTPVGALQSESLEGYSYTRASGQNGLLTWQEAYSSRLRPYRRMFTEVG